MTATIGAQKIEESGVTSMVLDEHEPFASIEGGPLGTRERTFWKSSDGTVETGVWECDAGRFHPDFGAHGEIIRVVSGEVVCTPDDGSETLTLRSGDMAVFSRGWTGEWDVRAPLRTVFTSWEIW